MPRGADIIARRVPEAVLRIVDGNLRAARRALDRDDAETLHDFRVALRRARAVLRAFDPWLPEIRRKDRRRLRKLARSTNVGRDAEVLLSLLTRFTNDLPHDLRTDVAGLRRRLRRRRRHAWAGGVDQVRAALRDAARPLRRRLRRQALTPPTFGEALGTLLAREAERLAGDLAALETSAAPAAVHVARLTTKRARYLLEPVARSVDGVAPLVRTLSALQSHLGDLHDLDVLADTVSAEIARVRDGATGAQALQRRIDDHRARLVDELRADWVVGASATVTANIAAVAHRMTPSGDVTPATMPAGR